MKDDHGIEATVNAERCRKIRCRPPSLEFDRGIDAAIDAVVRGPDSNRREVRSSVPSVVATPMPSEENFDDIVSELLPLRRSTRIRRKPDRLVMNIGWLFDDISAIDGSDHSHAAAQAEKDRSHDEQ